MKYKLKNKTDEKQQRNRTEMIRDNCNINYKDPKGAGRKADNENNTDSNVSCGVRRWRWRHAALIRF